MADTQPQHADTVVHRFSWLPYGGDNCVSVIVCDCGWCDITGGAEIGEGWDVACAYAVHMGHPDPRDLAKQRNEARLAARAHIDGVDHGEG